MVKTVYLHARLIVKHVNTLTEHAAAKLVGTDLTVAQVFIYSYMHCLIQCKKVTFIINYIIMSFILFIKNYFRII